MAGASTRVAITLGFDDAASAAVRRVSQRLDSAGISRQFSAIEVPPHLTLAACAGLDLERFGAMLEELAARTPALACTLTSLGVFPTAEGVLFLAPSISRDLVELQLEIFEHLGKLDAAVEPYWLPGQWVPHCTLATGIPPEQIATAVGLALKGLQPISGHLVRLSVVQIDPPAQCCEFHLYYDI